MRNIKLIIEYDGTNYSGWQIQPNKKTIQATIQKSLSKILNEKIYLKASGRTDAGVHAKGQVANFYTKSKLSCEDIKKGLNSILPHDIVVKRISKVPLNFHARFSAKSKIYRYQISLKNLSCFDRLYFCYVPFELNVKLIKRETRVIIGKWDFKSFQGSVRKAKDTKRTIKDIKIRQKGKLLYIDIEADGFLYNMVRNIIGTLVEIGRGKLPKGSMRRILRAKNRTKAGPTKEAKGLFLMKVRY